MRWHAAALALALVGAASSAHAMPDATLLALRFFDDNPLAQGEALSAASQRELEQRIGLALVARGRAADGAFLFAVASPADPARLRAALNELRATGAMVYADALHEGAAKRGLAAAEPARALLVKTRKRVTPDALLALRGTVAKRLDRDVAPARALGGGVQRIALPRALAAAEAAALVRDLAAHPDVEHVEIDRRATVQTIPTDPLFASQWNLGEGAGGVHAAPAWSTTTGEDAAPIAVLDTGILPHPDLAGRILPGYDMVSDPVFAADGDGRDPDPADPGDFVTAAEAAEAASPLYACTVTNSTWHGTMVAGALGATANNGIGIVGLNWRSPLLSVRVMGKCGGTLSDIADGIRWAAGLAVPQAPPNPTPARVINLSFSGHGECGAILQSAVTDAIARGAVVVAAAGNANADVGDRWPANCNGVVAVAATSIDGSRGFYSNYGARIAVAAPGGGIGGSLYVLRNGGTTVPEPTSWTYGAQVGTSLAAPHVSGTISLMQAVAPEFTPAELQAALEQTARPFPVVEQDACTTASCGTGIANVDAAVARVVPLQPIAPPPPATTLPPAPPSPPVETPPSTPPVETPPVETPPLATTVPPPFPVPVPGGWSAKSPEDLDRLLKGSDANGVGAPAATGQGTGAFAQ